MRTGLERYFNQANKQTGADVTEKRVERHNTPPEGKPRMHWDKERNKMCTRPSKYPALLLTAKHLQKQEFLFFFLIVYLFLFERQMYRGERVNNFSSTGSLPS